jgi:hypothetical protein
MANAPKPIATRKAEERRAMLAVSRMRAQFVGATDDPEHPVQRELAEAHKQLTDVVARMRHRGDSWLEVHAAFTEHVRKLKLPALDALRREHGETTTFGQATVIRSIEQEHGV